MKHLEWSEKYQRMQDICDRICKLRTERAHSLALSAEIDPCCIHNAAIDDELNGWCYRNPARLKIAKQCIRILATAFEGYRILEQWDRRVKEMIP